MTNDSLRRQFARDVAARCAIDRAFAELFQVRDAAGNRVVVPMLDSDTVELSVRLARQAGSDAMLVVLRENTRHVGFLRVTEIAPATARADCHVPVGSDCTLSDLLKILTPGASISLRQTRDGGEELRIDDFGESDLPGDPAGDLALT